MTDHSVCDYCAKLRKLDPYGRITRHYTRTRERVDGRTNRTRKIRRQCPGSGRPPRHVDR